MPSIVSFTLPVGLWTSDFGSLGDFRSLYSSTCPKPNPGVSAISSVQNERRCYLYPLRVMASRFQSNSRSVVAHFFQTRRKRVILGDGAWKLAV